MPTATGRLV